MSEATKSIFQTLYDADVTGKVKKKNGLSYISWAAAWAEVKKRYPDATYHVYTCQPDPYEETITEYKDGVPVMSRTVKRTPQPRPWFDDGKSAWVEVSVTINGQEAKETYAIMDFKNNAVKAEQVTSTDANKAKMRALAKACAQWGLGLYIYEGEDMPEGVKKERTGLADARKKVVSAAQAAVKKGVDRAKIYALIAEKNNGNDSPTEIPTIALCTEITTAIKAFNAP